MAREALLRDLPTQDVEGGEQVGDAVPPIVVGLALGNPPMQGKDRLGAVQRPDLGLLVDTEHEGVLEGIEIQADDVQYFLLQVLVRTALVVLESVGLDPTGPPDLMDGVGTDPEAGRHRSGRPVGGIRWLGTESVMHDGPDGGVRDQRGSAHAGGVPIETVPAEVVEPMAPESTGVGLCAELLSNLFVLNSVGSPQDDFGAQGEQVGGRVTTGPALEAD
jgi:hypothetical protein